MLLKNKRIALGITTPFYAIEKTIPHIEKMIQEGAEIIPIISFDINEDVKRRNKVINQIQIITGKTVINTIEEAELIGYKTPTDIMAIIPCSGNIIAKLANGILDTPVLITAKNNLKLGNNIVIGIATNEGLSIQAENIGKLLKQKNIFFVPFRQNNPITKPTSLVFSGFYIKESIEKALDGEQIQPVLI